MKTTLTILISLLFLNFSSFYEFKVKDSNNKTVPLVRIQITSELHEYNFDVYTDFDGTFKIPKHINHKETFLTFFHRDFKKFTIPMSNLSETKNIILR